MDLDLSLCYFVSYYGDDWDVKQVFDLIRYSKDKEKLKEITEQDEAYKAMSVDAYEVAASFIEGEELGLMKQRYEKEGRVNMCQGLRDWLEEERAEGKAEVVRNLMDNLQVSLEKAMELLGIPESEQEFYREKVNNKESVQ